jgi:hypothetical protein
MIKIVRFIKQKTFLNKTWHIESLFVLFILSAVALISGKGKVEWIGVAAVFFTFMHASVAERLAEGEQKRMTDGENVYVECHHKLPVYFYIKEICWLTYFALIGAWSAIVGVFIFLAYPLWKKYWRSQNN